MSADHRNPKVLLVGWDAADWKVIMPLIDAGKMPNLAGLIDKGICGNIATLQPVLSPMLWTSIATGKRAYKHENQKQLNVEGICLRRVLRKRTVSVSDAPDCQKCDG